MTCDSNSGEFCYETVMDNISTLEPNALFQLPVTVGIHTIAVSL